MHASIPVTGADLALNNVLFLRTRPRASYIYVTPYVGLFCYWLRPLLVGLLLALPLKSKLAPTVLGPWLIRHNSQNINNDAIDRRIAPFPLLAKQAIGT